VSLYRSDPAAPGANVGRQGDLALERALELFNASDATRTVAGLTRTLGKPRVSIGAAAGSACEVRITVGWELCWYQWCVDLGDERKPVLEFAKGRELSELDGSARQWNASAAKGGRVGLGIPVA
jgi:hypothetical protein